MDRLDRLRAEVIGAVEPFPGERAARTVATGWWLAEPLPPGTDAAARQEAAVERAGRVERREAVRPGEEVRQAGEDVPPGGGVEARLLEDDAA